jgi:hypothetical protein
MVWLLDRAVSTGFGLLDSMALPLKTPVNRATREQRERLKKPFPWLDERVHQTASTSSSTRSILDS